MALSSVFQGNLWLVLTRLWQRLSAAY